MASGRKPIHVKPKPVIKRRWRGPSFGAMIYIGPFHVPPPPKPPEASTAGSQASADTSQASGGQAGSTGSTAAGSSGGSTGGSQASSGGYTGNPHVKTGNVIAEYNGYKAVVENGKVVIYSPAGRVVASYDMPPEAQPTGKSVQCPMLALAMPQEGYVYMKAYDLVAIKRSLSATDAWCYNPPDRSTGLGPNGLPNLYDVTYILGGSNFVVLIIPTRRFVEASEARANMRQWAGGLLREAYVVDNVAFAPNPMPLGVVVGEGSKTQYGYVYRAPNTDWHWVYLPDSGKVFLISASIAQPKAVKLPGTNIAFYKDTIAPATDLASQGVTICDPEIEQCA